MKTPLYLGLALGSGIAWSLLFSTPAWAGAPTSPFLPSLEEVCRAPGGPSVPDPEIATYCGDRSQIPPFAAKREEERLARLDVARAAVGLPPTIRSQVPTMSRAVRNAVDPNLEPIGPLGRAIAGYALGQLCSTESVARTLPATCATSAALTMPTLRTALVSDLEALATVALDAGQADPTNGEVVLGLRLLASSLEGADIETLALRLSRPLTTRSGQVSPWFGVAVQSSATIVGRMLRDGPDLPMPDEHYVRVVEDVLGVPPPSAPAAPLGFVVGPRLFSAAPTRAQILGLVSALRQLATAQQNATASRVYGETLAMLDVLSSAHVVASETHTELVEADRRREIAEVTAAVLQQRYAALEAPIVRELERLRANGVLSERAACAGKTAVRIASASGDGEARRAALTCTGIDLPAWTSRLLLAAHAGMPVFSDDVTRIDADLLLGYNGDRWGIAGYGSLRNYDVTTTFARTETFREEGALTGWINFPVSETVRPELRANGGAALYNSDVFGRAGGFFEETSIMGRGDLLAGIRVQPSPGFALSFHGGGGLQVETWDSSRFQTTGTLLRANDTPVTAMGAARARAQWNVWPDILSLRLAVDGNYLGITRSRQDYVFGQTPPSGATESQVTQVELFTRGYVDLDVLRIFDVVRPSLQGGVNLVVVDGASVATPIFGVGLRRETL